MAGVITRADKGSPLSATDHDDNLEVVVSLHQGATEPSPTYASMLWADTSTSLMKVRNTTDTAWVTLGSLDTSGVFMTSGVLESSDIGVTVQAYDADTLKADVADTITAPMRGAVTTDNDLSFDMSVTNNFSCTPTGTGTLTFTNITAGQSGNIYVNNSGGYAISAHSTTLISSTDLSKLSTAGAYWVSYYSADGTNVSVAVSPALTSAGA